MPLLTFIMQPDRFKHKSYPMSDKVVHRVTHDGKPVTVELSPMEDITPGTLANPKKYGLWDIKEQTWMGTTDGPLTYDQRDIAQIVAQVMCERLAVPLGRIKVEIFTQANVKVGDVTPKVSAAEAIRKVFGE